MSKVKIAIKNGVVSFIYDDGVVAALEKAGLKTKDVQRASHVDWHQDWEHAGSMPGWYADLGPSDGPVLGPFKTRMEALKAEVAWIEEHLAELVR